MPALQRTPPTHSSSAADAVTSIPSPSNVFTRNTKIARTPPGGTAPLSPSSPAPLAKANPTTTPDRPPPDRPPPDTTHNQAATSIHAPLHVHQSVLPHAVPAPSITEGLPTPEETPMEIDEPESGPSNPAAFQTPVAKTPLRSTRPTNKTPAQMIAEPAIPIPVGEGLDVGDYGKRYEVTLDTLELAVRAASQKWTARNLEQCLPLLAAQNREAMRDVWLSASHRMRQNITAEFKDLLEFYKIGPALQAIDELVRDGKEFATDQSRLDAWRPDLTPATLVAAQQLPLLDDVYARLRDEFLGLHNDCAQRYQSIREKEALLASLGVSAADGDLDQTVEMLQGFPNEDMMLWMEQVASGLEGARRA